MWTRWGGVWNSCPCTLELELFYVGQNLGKHSRLWRSKSTWCFKPHELDQPDSREKEECGPPSYGDVNNMAPTKSTPSKLKRLPQSPGPSTSYIDPCNVPIEPTIPHQSHSSCETSASCLMAPSSSKLCQTELRWCCFSGVGQGWFGCCGPRLSRKCHCFTIWTSSLTVFTSHSGSHGCYKNDNLRTRTWY